MVHSRAVQAAGLLLQRFDQNSAFTNHCVAKLLHRIAWEAKMPAMLYQASLFRSFQRVLKSPLPQHKELQKLAQFVVKKFTEVAVKNPLLYIELLFWKSSREACELEEGYGSYQEKSAANKKMWKEEEEDELRLLFQEFERDQPGGDVVDWILSKLINQNRSKNAVRKKLQDLFLLVPKSKMRPPKEWGEQELVQLQELFDQYRDSDSPMDNVLAGLTVKRPKVRVIEKLLELGVVNDRKELYKRGRKSKTGNLRTGGDFDNDEIIDSDDSSSDSDDSNTNHYNKTAKNTQKDRIALKKARRGKTGRAPPGQVTAMLLQVVSSGLIGGIKWLKESLDDAAEDLEKDPSEDVDGIPLVPVEDDAVTAMENPIFQRLLQALGIVPPFDEQESYWRIPGDMKAPEMRQKSSVLQMALDGTLDEKTSEQLLEESQVGSAASNQNSSDSEDEFDALRKITSTQRSETTNGATQSTFDQLLTTQSSSSKKQKRVRVMQSDDSGDDSTHIPKNDTLNELSSDEEKSSKSSKKNTLDSDSDDDDASATPSNFKSQSRAVSKNKEKSSKSSKKNTLDSDSDNDDANGTPSNFKSQSQAVSKNKEKSSKSSKKNTLDSDSDDDDDDASATPSNFKSQSRAVSKNKEKSSKSSKKNTLDSDSDNDDANETPSKFKSQSRAVFDSDSENDGSNSVKSPNLHRSRQVVIDSDSDDGSEITRGSNFGSQSTKSCSPLKESSLLNISQNRTVLSSDEEMDVDEGVNNRPNKGTKHFLSSSEDSGGESKSPKKSRYQEFNKLRM